MGEQAPEGWEIDGDEAEAVFEDGEVELPGVDHCIMK